MTPVFGIFFVLEKTKEKEKKKRKEKEKREKKKENGGKKEKGRRKRRGKRRGKEEKERKKKNKMQKKLCYKILDKSKLAPKMDYLDVGPTETITERVQPAALPQKKSL